MMCGRPCSILSLPPPRLLLRGGPKCDDQIASISRRRLAAQNFLKLYQPQQTTSRHKRRASTAPPPHTLNTCSVYICIKARTLKRRLCLHDAAHHILAHSSSRVSCPARTVHYLAIRLFAIDRAETFAHGVSEQSPLISLAVMHIHEWCRIKRHQRGAMLSKTTNPTPFFRT